MCIRDRVLAQPENQIRSGPKPIDASPVISTTDSWAAVAADPPNTHSAAPETEGQHKPQEALNNSATIPSVPESAKKAATRPEEQVPDVKQTLDSTTTKDAEVARQASDPSQSKIPQDAETAVGDTKHKADDIKKNVKDLSLIHI